MGLFGIGYNKQKKDLEKEDLQKHRFLIFFEVVFRKFMKFAQLNMLYLLFSLPYLLLLYCFSPFNANTIAGTEIGAFVNNLPQEDFRVFDIVLRMIFMFTISILWGSGPASAGSAYIMRNFAREEHAWVLSDFWDNVKQNFKQSMGVLVIDILVLYFSLVGFNFYSSQYALVQNQVFLIAQGILVVMLFVYTLMHYYIYQLMVGYENSFKNLYKNSMLFAIARFPQNIIFTVIVFGIIIGLFLLLNIFAFLAFVMIFTIICRFIIAFYTSGVIAKMASLDK